MECFSTNIPTITFTEDPCEGKTMFTQCIIHEGAITYLGLPANSTVEDIIEALVLSLQDTRNRLQIAEDTIADHEIRIEALENP